LISTILDQLVHFVEKRPFRVTSAKRTAVPCFLGPPVGDGIFSLPGDLAGSHGIVCLGSWWPYGNRQFGSFSRAGQTTNQLEAEDVVGFVRRKKHQA